MSSACRELGDKYGRQHSIHEGTDCRIRDFVKAVKSGDPRCSIGPGLRTISGLVYTEHRWRAEHLRATRSRTMSNDILADGEGSNRNGDRKARPSGRRRYQ